MVPAPLVIWLDADLEAGAAIDRILESDASRSSSPSTAVEQSGPAAATVPFSRGSMRRRVVGLRRTLRPATRVGR